MDLSRATGVIDLNDDLISKLSRVVQLTGFSDPVYAEAIVNVHQFDILLGKYKQIAVQILTLCLPNLTLLYRCSYRQSNEYDAAKSHR